MRGDKILKENHKKHRLSDSFNFCCPTLAANKTWYRSFHKNLSLHWGDMAKICSAGVFDPPPSNFIEPKRFWSKKICSKKDFGPKKMLVQKNFSPKIKSFVTKKFGTKKILVWKKIWSEKKNFVKFFFFQNKFSLKKYFGPKKKFGPKKILVRKVIGILLETPGQFSRGWSFIFDQNRSDNRYVLQSNDLGGFICTVLPPQTILSHLVITARLGAITVHPNRPLSIDPIA